MRRALAILVLLAGCPGDKAPLGADVAPVTSRGTAVEDVTQLVALDAADGLALPDELGAKVKRARARIPSFLAPSQREALEELESRYERLEAQLEGASEDGIPKDHAAHARLLASYFWERLRLFDPSLDPEVPVEIFGAFARTARRGD